MNSLYPPVSVEQGEGASSLSPRLQLGLNPPTRSPSFGPPIQCAVRLSCNGLPLAPTEATAVAQAASSSFSAFPLALQKPQRGKCRRCSIRCFEKLLSLAGGGKTSPGALMNRLLLPLQMGSQPLLPTPAAGSRVSLQGALPFRFCMSIFGSAGASAGTLPTGSAGGQLARGPAKWERTRSSCPSSSNSPTGR